MSELLASFFAGILTVAAPCVLPVLPVIIGGSTVPGTSGRNRLLSPLVIIAGLVTSIVAFTLLLKATTALLGIPTVVWQGISAGIIFVFGLHYVFPNGWSWLSSKLGLVQGSDRMLERSQYGNGLFANFLMGAALGPVFNSCSPTYALIIAIILPRSFSEGLTHLIVYSVGLGVVLLAIAFAGRSVVQFLRPLANPTGGFRKAIGLVLIIVALALATGYDKKLQAFILEKGWYDPIANLEHQLGK